MKPEVLNGLTRLLEINFQKQQRAYSKILAHESRLRGEIRKLDEKAKAAEVQCSHQILAIGADVIWKAWLDKTRRVLNLELAHVLAQKETLKSGVQKEYGKLIVSGQIKQKLETASKEKERREILANAVVETAFAGESVVDCDKIREHKTEGGFAIGHRTAG